jgi:hypothetical protein
MNFRSLVRGLMGARPSGAVTGHVVARCVARTPRTRVRLPSVGEIPADVLRVLRAFNHDLDAYMLPDGRVWLLKYEENKGRILEGRKMLFVAKQEGDYAQLETAHLMAEGWSLLGELSFQEGTSAGAMLRHAQMTLYATPRQIEEDHRRRKEISDGTDMIRKARAAIAERLTSNATFDHSYAFKGRKSFDYHRARLNPLARSGTITSQRG